MPETISALRKAGLQIWVLTGDKQETAVNIAYACKLLEPEEEIITLNADSQEACAVLLEESLHYIQAKFVFGGSPPDQAARAFPLKDFGAFETPSSTSSSSTASSSSHPTPFLVHRLGLVIDGRTLAYALDKSLEDKFLAVARSCRSVLCCRSTPLQKSMVVKLVRNKLKVMTLAIGDGANDVSMIQVADVGVGISGQEGMQAVMASDFAMPRFQSLQKLLLVHGHWCYSRLANMILYFFYKNAMFVALIFWYQFYCGFSGSAMVDQWYLVFFNLMFSAFPQLIIGTLDKDVSAETLQLLPQLYMNGQNSEEYKPYMFWMNMIDAFYQSLVCFFIPYFAYADSDVDLFTWGTPITTLALLTILLHLGIETKTWTWMNWVSMAFSVALFFTVALCYNGSCPTCYSPSNPYWTMQRLLGDPLFYLLCIVTPVAALLPRYFYRACQGVLFPSPVQVGRQLDQLPGEIRGNILSLSGLKAGSLSLFGLRPPFLSYGRPYSTKYSHGAQQNFTTDSSKSHQGPRDNAGKCPEKSGPLGADDSKEGLSDPYTLASSQTDTLPYTKEGLRPAAAPQRVPAGADNEGLDKTLDPSDGSLSSWMTSTPRLCQGEGVQLTLPPAGAAQCVTFKRDCSEAHRPDHIIQPSEKKMEEQSPHTDIL